LILHGSQPLHAQANWKENQLQYARVRAANAAFGEGVMALLSAHDLSLNRLRLFIRVIKDESQLEVWAKSGQTTTFSLLRTYEICSQSGTLGPKRRQGDFQVPEGFYYIDRFNPISNFHLSLGLNYPNASDRHFSDSARPGSDIFIHGACVSIGCLALTDPVICELYLLAVEAKNAGQQTIPVHIFPFRMDEERMAHYAEAYPQHVLFWQSLQKGYQYFETQQQVPETRADPRHYYQLH
jgi:murein L,D-transpeptidase YafK